MAASSGANFFEVTPSSIISKFHGETETLIKALFKVAEADSPSLVFIDEIDSLLGKRREKEDDASIRMKNQLLQMMDGMSSCGDGENDKILVVVGATNRPDMLDEAAIRRLSKRVLVPLPDLDARRLLIRNVLQKQSSGGCALNDEELTTLASRVEGWNGSDIRSLCVTASERSYDETVHFYGGIQNVPDRHAFRPISYQDFLGALQEWLFCVCGAGASFMHFRGKFEIFRRLGKDTRCSLTETPTSFSLFLSSLLLSSSPILVLLKLTDVGPPPQCMYT
ncbi:aaa family protein [Cystoisospora suis]|uniref:Aaa family protein n=1 Tax=Cystoisospora suis TaxID=483139 RepID=A0A2C6K963_9APIC|nr:aaa family protein [Cystoisospora suis]